MEPLIFIYLSLFIYDIQIKALPGPILTIGRHNSVQSFKLLKSCHHKQIFCFKIWLLNCDILRALLNSLLNNMIIVKQHDHYIKKWFSILSSFPLKISSVHVIKFAGIKGRGDKTSQVSLKGFGDSVLCL